MKWTSNCVVNGVLESECGGETEGTEGVVDWIPGIKGNPGNIIIEIGGTVVIARIGNMDGSAVSQLVGERTKFGCGTIKGMENNCSGAEVGIGKLGGVVRRRWRPAKLTSML